MGGCDYLGCYLDYLDRYVRSDYATLHVIKLCKFGIGSIELG